MCCFDSTKTFGKLSFFEVPEVSNRPMHVQLIPTYYYISTIPTLYTQYYTHNLHYDYEKNYINNYILCVTNYDVCLEEKEYKSVF